MKVAIHQPQYWPWPPYIHKILSADVFIYLDTVDFSKNGLQNRNQVKTRKGATWLTIPVQQHLGQTIYNTNVADLKALDKHYKTLIANYSHTTGFRRWGFELKSLLSTNSLSLCEIAIASTEWMLDKLDCQTTRRRASDLRGAEGEKSSLVASICNILGATAYLTGKGALDYLNPTDFSTIDCDVWVQEWNSLVYEQALPENGFVADLSTLDLLLNCPDTAREQIEANGSWIPLGSVV